MTKENSLGYTSLIITISELKKIGENLLANKLLDTISQNELPKSDKHNCKNDKTTSYFEIKITEDEKEKIIDLFINLEVENLTKDGETTGAASHYSDMVSFWESIIPTRIKLISKYNNQIFEIVEDNSEVGFYLYVYDSSGKNTHDHLQNTLQITKEFAYEEFGVPLNSWETVYT